MSNIEHPDKRGMIEDHKSAYLDLHRVHLEQRAELKSVRQQLQGAVDLVRATRGYVAASADKHKGQPERDLLRRIDAALSRARGR